MVVMTKYLSPLMKFLVPNVSSLNRSLLVLLIVLAATIVPVLYCIQGITDIFLFWHVAFVEKHINSTFIPLEDPLLNIKYFPGAILIILIISRVTGLAPGVIQFTPIIGMLLPIVYYSLARKFIHSGVIAAIIVLMMMNIPTPTTFFTIWPHAFGFLSYLIFTLACLHVVQDITLKRYKGAWVLLIMIVFFAIHFYSYTAESWAISLSIIYTLLVITTGLLFKYRVASLKTIGGLTAAFLIVLFAFNQIFFESYLPRGQFISTMLSSSEIFLNSNNLFFLSQEIGEYIYQPEPHPLLSLLTLLYLSLTVGIILLGVVISVRHLFLYKQSKSIHKKYEREIYWLYSLFMVGAIDMLIYAARGVITWRYIYFIFPLLAGSFLGCITKNERAKICILTIILCITLVHTGLSWQAEKFVFNPSKYEDTEYSIGWFKANAASPEALIDLRTGNKYLLEFTKKNEEFQRRDVLSDHYKYIVDPEYSTNTNHHLSSIAPYIIMNMDLKKIESTEWQYFKPFYYYSSDINSNVNLQKVYSDSKIWILKT